MTRTPSDRQRRWSARLMQPPRLPPAPGRIEAIDLARGMAITLMILSHGVKGLLTFEQIPDWGMVPIHLVTKFSSSLFIMVFGIALAVAFLPHVASEDWPRRRLKLLLRGLVVLFWYKILTIVEMVHLHEPEQIVDALLYQAFPIWVEILGFYAIALLWVPFFLPLWYRMPLLLRLASPLLLAGLAYLLARYFDFWGLAPLRAILVEHDDYYTWGQLTRGPLVLLGLLIGELLLNRYHRPGGRRALAGWLGACALGLLACFVVVAAPALFEQLMAIARNEGKHPPELAFTLFSLGGALLLLALAVLGGERLAAALRPITVIGSDALKAFVFHIFVIFIVLRYLLGYWHAISYPHALTLTLLLILATALWIKLTSWVRARA